MSSLSSPGSVDEWEWLDSAAKATGLPWCGWPREWSSSKTACRTCIPFYSRIQRGSNHEKQLEHIEKQKQFISKRKLMEKQRIQRDTKHTDKQLEELQRERATEDITHPKKTRHDAIVDLVKRHDTDKQAVGQLQHEREELKRDGQYCTYHHSTRVDGRCHCKRDREGYLKWYSSYDKRKYCMVCDSQRCSCTRNTKGHIIPKIVVKLIYEEENGLCRIHTEKKVDGCECPSSIKSVVTITHDGTDFQKYCTLHQDTGCDCGETPKFYKIIKMIGYEYL